MTMFFSYKVRILSLNMNCSIKITSEKEKKRELKKPVVMKTWSPELDLAVENVKRVPTWIRFEGLPLKYWGQSSLHKLAGLIGTPIRIDRVTTQKDMLAYARVLIEVSIEQVFPDEIHYVNEKGLLSHQAVKYECKPMRCTDCGGFGHDMEECRKKRIEVAMRKIQPRKQWVPRLFNQCKGSKLQVQ